MLNTSMKQVLNQNLEKNLKQQNILLLMRIILAMMLKYLFQITLVMENEVH